MSPSNPQTTYLAQYQPPVFFIKQVELQVILHEQGTLVRSTLHIQRNPLADATDTTLCLHGIGLQHRWVAIDDQRLSDGQLSLADDSLSIRDVPDACVFSSEVQIAPCLLYTSPSPRDS